MRTGLTRGQLAQQGEVNFETIRFYEREGLLPPPSRTVSGYRQYPPATVRRLQFIRHAKELGFSLEEIRELLELRTGPDRDCTDVRRQTDAKIAQVDEKIRQLQAIRRALARLADSCSGHCKLSECPILEALDRMEQ